MYDRWEFKEKIITCLKRYARLGNSGCKYEELKLSAEPLNRDVELTGFRSMPEFTEAPAKSAVHYYFVNFAAKSPA